MVFLKYLQKCFRNLNQGATAHLLVMYNRTAIYTQHGFQAAWFGGLWIATTSSARGGTARITVIVQPGWGFLSGGRREAPAKNKEDCFKRATITLTKAIQHTYIISPVNIAGLFKYQPQIQYQSQSNTKNIIFVL